jgi:hypothetical protein
MIGGRRSAPSDLRFIERAMNLRTVSIAGGQRPPVPAVVDPRLQGGRYFSSSAFFAFAARVGIAQRQIFRRRVGPVASRYRGIAHCHQNTNYSVKLCSICAGYRAMPGSPALNRYFHLGEGQTTVGREFRGAIATAACCISRGGAGQERNHWRKRESAYP